MRGTAVLVKVITPHEPMYNRWSPGCIFHCGCTQFVWEEQQIYMHCITYLNYVTDCLQTYKEKHSFRSGKNWLDQMRGLRRIFSFPCLHSTKECEALGGFCSRGQVLRVSVRAQRPDIPQGMNACGYYDQQSKGKWGDSTNRCQSSILAAFEPSELEKSVLVCVCGSLSWGGWLQAASGAGRLCSWLQLK